MNRYCLGNAANADERGQWNEWFVTRRRLLQMSGFATAGLLPVLRNRSACAQAATPVPGGQVRLAHGYGGVETFDPVAATDNASIFAMLLVYEQLVRVAADGASLEPGLAERWEIAADGLTYTFHLRQASFHDGSPCTAADVIFSLERVRTDPASVLGFLFSAIATFDSPDAATVVIQLTSPWTPLLADLALFSASVVSKTAHDARQGNVFTNPIGTGPFSVVSWAPYQETVLTKNADYWDPGKPLLEGATLAVIADPNERLAQVRSGTLDIAIDIPLDAIAALRTDPTVTVFEGPLARVDFLALNTSRPPFDDKTLRQAVGHAIDRQKIIDTVFAGGGTVANTFLPLIPMHDDTAAGLAFDLDKAKALAATAAPNGFDAELIVDSSQNGYDAMADLIAADLAQIGGRITVTGHLPDFFGRWSTGDYDLAASYATSDILDPSELTLFMVVGTGPIQALYTFYDNPEVDQLAAAAPAMTDPVAQAAAYARIQAIVNEDAPLIPLFYLTSNAVTSPHVKNFSILPTGNFRLWETWRDDA